jgi:SAM-dependent methyltransferase
MDECEVGRFWEENAEVWTMLARQGYDRYRDLLNTPAFFDLLPDVSGMRGLDVGCGEGHNTRLLADRGAEMWAVDIAPAFVGYAREAGTAGVHYLVAGGQRLPFPDGAFDFVTAVMCLMDMPQPDQALSEAARVLKPGGFLQFSITHPFTDTPHRRSIRNSEGMPCAFETAGYFDRVPGRVDVWIFSTPQPEVRAGLRPFRVPQFHRTLAEWLNAVVDAGFALERISEPHASAETAARFPFLAATRVAAYFLHVRCRKPAATSLPG